MTIVKNILDTKNVVLICTNRLEINYIKKSGNIISCEYIDTG